MAEFCRWSLQLPEMNEATRTMLFVCGLLDRTQREVLRDHPWSLFEAISGARAALCYSAQIQMKTSDVQVSTALNNVHAKLSMKQLHSPPTMIRALAYLKKLTQEERTRLLREGKCSACRKAGHLARSCPTSNTRFKPARIPKRRSTAIKHVHASAAWENGAQIQVSKQRYRPALDRTRTACHDHRLIDQNCSN